MDANLETRGAMVMAEHRLACERADRRAPVLDAYDRSRSAPMLAPGVRLFARRGDRTPGIGVLRWLGRAINRGRGVAALIHPRATA